ncbi:condensation domain-containing protein [Streptomyces koyangensis]|uniref:condensation domain-containing protein n=1 Tax=Streptomyces koyangensis TaxID=188770 RepID=UPI003C2F0B04
MTDDRDAEFREAEFRAPDVRGVVGERDAGALGPGGPAHGGSPDEMATTVVVGPGQPHGTPPVLEVRGPLTPERVAAVLERAAGSQGREHRLERLGPGRHLLHVGPGDGTFPAGHVADLLTSRETSGLPLGPAQLALLRRREAPPGRHPVVLVDVPEPLDAARVEAALRALVAAHPLLGARIRVHPAPGGVSADPPVHEALCTVAEAGRAREAAAVEEAGRRLDPATGRTLAALLLRGRRRLAVVAHELVADAASVGVLRAGLRALLLDGGAAGEDVRYTDWIASLPAVAADPATVGRWRTVAEGRAAARAFRPRAPLPDAPPVRHPGFVLGKAATARLTGDLPGHFGLTPVQLLTGAVGLALARWRGTGHASFDVHADGRQDSPALARTVGPLAGTEPVLLMDAGHDAPAREFVGHAARRLALVGRASFAACREYAADPALRLVLRELVPVLARFTPTTGTHRPPRPVVPYALDLTAGVRAGGRLRVGLDWVAAPREGVTEESADRLLALLREVLEELADRTVRPGPGRRGAPSSTVAASPLQRELLADADAHPGTGRQIGQLAWTWHGRLDDARFTASWQSVFDHEAVLRSSFGAGTAPRVIVHDRVEAEVVRLSRTPSAWPDVLTGDRRRGLDPRSPGPLRVTLLEGPPPAGPEDGPVPPTRVLLTYHQALLDTWSVRLLLEEFYRAYVAGGTLPGGDRRPDLRDHAHWLAGQDLTAARDFWQRLAPAPALAAAALPAGPPAAPGAGTGRCRLRLDSAEASRLRTWAARWGATESGALQAVWALLLYRESGATGPAPVRFSVAVTGRGIPLDGVERLPGALCNPVPVSVEVDPAATVPDLLARLRDWAVDLAAYEWVSAGQIREWTGTGAETGDTAPAPGSLLVFDGRRASHDGLEPSLAALGVRVDPPETTGTATAFPVTLASHDAEGGGLVLTVDHDRARLADASGVLAHVARLLRELPDRADDVTTVARLLDAVSGATDPGAAFLTLRPGTGGVVCLVPSPDVPDSWYVRLARLYAGPEALILLHPAPEGTRAWYEALRPMADEGRLPALGAFSGGGAEAYELARLVAASGARPPAVVLGAGGGGDLVREFARVLGGVAARHPDGG